MTESVVLSCSTCGNRLQIPIQIERFACIECGCEQEVRRGGGIIALQPVMRGESGGCLDAYSLAINRLHEQIRDTRLRLEKEINWQHLSVPAYVLLKYDFHRIGKLGSWSIHFTSEDALEKIFRSLTVEDLNRLIRIYDVNPRGPTRAWLIRVRELQNQLDALEFELNRLKNSAGLAV